MLMYMSEVQGSKSQPKKPQKKLPKAVFTYKGLMMYQTRIANLGPKKSNAVKKQHIVLYLYSSNEISEQGMPVEKIGPIGCQGVDTLVHRLTLPRRLKRRGRVRPAAASLASGRFHISFLLGPTCGQR